MHIQDYVHNINEIVSNNQKVFLPNNQPEFDLINLTKPLREISQLNKKYSLVNFDEEFLNALNVHEKENFLQNIISINNLLMNFFAKYHTKISPYETNTL